MRDTKFRMTTDVGAKKRFPTTMPSSNNTFEQVRTNDGFEPEVISFNIALENKEDLEKLRNLINYDKKRVKLRENGSRNGTLYVNLLRYGADGEIIPFWGGNQGRGIRKLSEVATAGSKELHVVGNDGSSNIRLEFGLL